MCFLLVRMCYQVASLQSPLELVLNLAMGSPATFDLGRKNRQALFQAQLTSVASVNVLVLAVPPVVFAFTWTSLLEHLVLHFVLSVPPIWHGPNLGRI